MLSEALAKLNPKLLGDDGSTGEEENQSLMDHVAAIYKTRIMASGPNRTAMGEYIVPPGGKTLTSLGDCSPAPSDYSPKVALTKPSAPQYSVAGRHKTTKHDYHASPADNDTSKTMTWSDKSISLKEKGRTRPYDVRVSAHVNDSVGPARYRVEHNGLGTFGPRWSVASRHMEGVNAGPPDNLVRPVDTHGVNTPGPNYRPTSRYWGRGPKKSFGSSRKDKANENPGPAEYSINDQPDGPAYTLAKRLPPPLSWRQSVNTDSPGPGSYDLGTTVGKAQAKSVSGRHQITQKKFVPAPNLYTLPDTVNNVPTAQMTYRPFEQNEGPHPGPTQYSVTDANLNKAPAYSCGKHTKPSFPDILRYPLVSQKHPPPGPGEYEEPTKTNISSNDKPKFSMGKRAKTPKNSVPGPNHYQIKTSKPPGAKCAPAFSMARRVVPIDKRVSPGPAAYNPKQPTFGSSGYSMTKRPNASSNLATPAPNAYDLANNQTNKGKSSGPNVSLKSRASPYVYSGFHNTSMIKG